MVQAGLRDPALTTILAIDPGLTHPGAAIILGDKLVAAERVKLPKEWSKLEILDRCDAVAGAVISWFGSHFLPKDDELRVIVEWPQWYGDDKTIDPNDLAGLCGIAGAAVGRARALTYFRSTYALISVLSPRPREVWGNVPKVTKGDPWKSPRGARLKSRLSADELAAVAPYHDALDAAGLALFAAGRWKQRRLFPGAV